MIKVTGDDNESEYFSQQDILIVSISTNVLIDYIELSERNISYVRRYFAQMTEDKLFVIGCNKGNPKCSFVTMFKPMRYFKSFLFLRMFRYIILDEQFLAYVDIL